MAESLVLGDIELLGQVVNTNPMCGGAVFCLLPGFDPGGPQPTTSQIQSMLLDGEINTGRRASNRTVTLPIWIFAPSRDVLSGAREHLEQIIDQEMWTTTWTRERDTTGTLPALPMLLDCQRAAATAVEADLVRERQFCMKLTIKFPALPYGRADTQEQLRFASPVPSGPPSPPSPVSIDTFSTITNPLCYQSPRCVIGPSSCAFDPDQFGDPGGQNSLFDYVSVLASPLNLTGMSSVAMYLGLGSRYYWNLRYRGTEVHRVTLVLTDTSGNTLSMTRNDLRLPVTPLPQSPYFSPVSMRIPANDPVFNYSAVAAYELTVSNHHPFGDHHLRWVTLYVDALTAYPDSVTVTPVTRGAVYTLYGLKGTARAPVSLAFTQPATAGTSTTVTTSGVSSYTVPANTNWLKVEAVGAGGPGSSRSSAGMGGGGGAAEYAREDVFPNVGTEVIPYNVGTGGTPGNDGSATQFGPGLAGPLVVLANPGKAAPANSISAGVGGTGSPNTVHHDGGAGRTASGSFGGGGGSSGGSSSPGSTPLGTSATSFTSPGSFSWTCPAGVTQVFAESWGSGGGAGSGGPTGNGQGAGGGEYASGFVPVTPGNVYGGVVAAGGLGATSTSTSGNNGNSSSFTGDGGFQVLAHGGQRGVFTNSGSTPANGGTGSSNSVHHNGGGGGAAEPYGGGGGSSASPSGNGNAGNGYAGAGAAPTDGGGGGAGSGPTNNVGGNGTVPGGGGGGTWENAQAGNGAAGKVRLTFPGGSPDQFGAPSVTGGGAGGNGGATANSAGSAGAQPGGGGGGANSAGTSETAGNGGNGRLIITPYAPSAFKSLIVHRPPRGASKNFQPLVSVGAGADTPNGGTWYTFPQPVSGVNARLNGTFTVYLINSSFNGSGSRTVTVTFRQTEYSGGPTYTTTTIPVSFTPSQITNGVLLAGVVTLPVKKIGSDNTQASFAVSVTDTNTSDRWYDCILLDTMGQTVVINEPSTGFLTYYLDAPDPNTRVGNVYGTQSDRSAAVSVMGEITAWSGGPMSVEPVDGENLLFAYCPGALAPAVGVTYSPTFYFDRTT
jgi:hypothetical protein